LQQEIEMAETTMIPDYRKNATPEEIWALVRENWEYLRKTSEKHDEDYKKMKETQEQTKEAQEQQWEQTKEAQKQLWEQMKETDKKIGELGNRFGELAEHLVTPSINKKFNELGFTFEQISQNIIISDSTGRSLAEIDILLENGDTVIAVEIKSKPNQRDAGEHIARMEVLRRRADARNDARKFRGAIAGAIMSDEVRRFILKTGFYVIEQTGDTVRINIPEGFKPREW